MASIADASGMDVPDTMTPSFERDVGSRGQVWARLVREHGLAAPAELERLVNHNSFVYAN